MAEAAGSMSDAVHERVRTMIARCELEPGRWITEKEIVSLTGFGLAPVRAALSRLRHEGLLEVVPRVGYRVRPMDAADIEDLFDIWALVAPAVVARTYGRVTDEEIEDHVADLGPDAARLAPGGSTGWEYWFAAKAHMLWIAANCGSPRLLSIYLRLAVDIQRCFALLARTDGAVEAMLASQPDLLGWLRARRLDLVLAHTHQAYGAARRLTLDSLARADAARTGVPEPAAG